MANAAFDSQITFCTSLISNDPQRSMARRSVSNLPATKAPIQRVPTPLSAFATTGGLEPGGVIITLVSDEVDAWLRGLPAMTSRGLLRTNDLLSPLFVRDPDGHLVEIQRFNDPLPAGLRQRPIE